MTVDNKDMSAHSGLSLNDLLDKSVTTRSLGTVDEVLSMEVAYDRRNDVELAWLVYVERYSAGLGRNGGRMWHLSWGVQGHKRSLVSGMTET
ncbi:hypothetical protein ACLOJK_011033 [Asimina triloba]